MIDRTVIARLLFIAPRVVERLRDRTLLARQSFRPELTMSVEELEAITTDFEQLYLALAQTRQQLRELRLRERSA